MTSNDSLDQRADALLAEMTLEEKAGQLSQYFYFGGWQFQTDFVESQIRAGHAGSLLFVADPRETNRLQRIALQETRLAIPLLFGFDVVHGLRTIAPVPIGMAASWDPALVERTQTMAAREARAVGIHWAFAPMLDIARDARWGRIVEGAGEDPYLGAQMGAAQVRGFQGEAIGAADRILAGPKHYIGYGAALGGRDYDEVAISAGDLRNVYLPPFEASIAAGAANVMTSYVGIDGVPGAADRRLITDLLRGELGFEGFVVSDASSVMDLVTHHFARDKQDAAVRALTAGLDMEMFFGVRFNPDAPPTPTTCAYSTLADAVRAGSVSEAMLDVAVRRILMMKLRLGLFEQPYVDEARAQITLQDTAHHEAVRIAAERSAVLLRNEQNILPLNRGSVGSVAVLGPLADDRAATIGPWVFAHDLAATVTVLDGLRQVAGSGVHIEHAAGLTVPTRTIPSPFAMMAAILGAPATTQAVFDEATEMARAIELARSADVAVVVLGEAADMNGEVASRSTLDLPGRQLELLEAVAATGTPVVLVLLSGRPLDLRAVLPHTAAVLMAWHPGTQGGTAIARLLFGDAIPGGKLPISWPRSVGQVPIIYARLTSHQPQTSHQRYWEEESTPLFPFGYGLSYGSVEYRNLTLSRSEIGLDETLEISVEIHNPSAGTVEEVAQLYTHQRYGRAARPVRELKGFERMTLAAGETRTVRFPLTAAARRYWSVADAAYVVDETTFDVWVGGDSTASLHAVFTVRG
jgi:beta-glucosidase